LALLTIFLGLIVAQSAMFISWAQDTGYRGSPAAWAIARAALSVVWLVANYMLLFGRRARLFFA
jgi:hypothetical protein